MVSSNGPSLVDVEGRHSDEAGDSGLEKGPVALRHDFGGLSGSVTVRQLCEQAVGFENDPPLGLLKVLKK